MPEMIDLKVPRRVEVSIHSRIEGDFADTAAGVFMRTAPKVRRERRGDVYDCFHAASKHISTAGKGIQEAALYDALERQGEHAELLWGGHGIFVNCLRSHGQ